MAIALAGALIYSLINGGFRLLASQVLGEDDVLDTILSQDLQRGYDAVPRQPPLYNWVLWGVQQMLGSGVAGFLLIKYAALIASAGFLYSTALRAIGDRLWALLAVESLALIYSVAWRFHEGFTHEVGAMVAVTATTWALVRIVEKGRLADFVVIGITCGLGFLTEPAFTVFLATLLFAGMLQPSIRSRLLRPELTLSLFIAATCTTPYLYWLAEDGQRLKAISEAPADRWRDTMRGLYDAIRGPFFYLSPLIIILPVMFPRLPTRLWQDLCRPPNLETQPDLEQLLMHSTLAAFGLCIIGALALAISDQAVHVLMPLYLMSVVWLIGAARRSCDAPARMRRFMRLALAIAVVALIARLANMFVLDPVCNICRWGVPYDGLAAEMRQRGFSGGSIVSTDHELAGNIRGLFPQARVVTRGRLHHTPSGVDTSKGRFAVVWPARTSDRDVARLLSPGLLPQPAIANAAQIDVPWRHLWRPAGYRISSWKLVVIER